MTADWTSSPTAYLLLMPTPAMLRDANPNVAMEDNVDRRCQRLMGGGDCVRSIATTGSVEDLCVDALISVGMVVFSRFDGYGPKIDCAVDEW